MSGVVRQFLLFLICIFIFNVSFVNAEEYRLGPGDILAITVWGYEDLSFEQGASGMKSTKPAPASNGLAIRPDGKISFPLAGEVTAAGLTAAELTAALTQALSEYIINPKVTVNVIGFKTTRVYVLGEVPRPGMYELEKEHSLIDAVGAAGGYTKYAAKKSVFLIRSGPGIQTPQKINLLKILKEGDMSQNVVLNEGDVVFLSGNGKVDFTTDILPFVTGAYYIARVND